MAGGKGGTQTLKLDPRSQRFVNQQLRPQATAARDVALGTPESFIAGPTVTSADDVRRLVSLFGDPFSEEVIDATRADFADLRGQTAKATAQEATRAGAFGGSRAAAASGARLGQIDRAEAAQLANLRSANFQQALGTGLAVDRENRAIRQTQLQEPLLRQQFALNALNLGLGPVGESRSTSSNPFGAALGGALAGGSQFGLPGAIIGGLGGLFGG